MPTEHRTAANSGIERWGTTEAESAGACAKTYRRETLATIA